MSKIKTLLFLVLILFLVNAVQAQNLRSKLISVAQSQVGVKEKGYNAGKDVEKYLSAVGLKKGNPWCAAFVAWCYEQVNLPHPRSGYCPAWFTSNVIYERVNYKLNVFEAKPGQVFGLYFESKRRIAHVGIITGQTKYSYETIEGNTDGSGTRDGDGVYKMLRNKRSIYVIADYCQS
jgi:hypothetical protein